jgi:hypothetical protein
VTKRFLLALLSYRFLLWIAVVLGLGWCAFLAAGVADPKAIGPYAISSIGILSGGSAFMLRQRLSVSWTGTVPGYRNTHIAAALFFCVYAFGTASASATFLGFPLMFALCLWFFGVISFFVAFFCVTVWRVAAAPSLYGVLVGFSPFLAQKLALDANAYVTTTLVLANAALTTLAILRIRRAAKDPILSLMDAQEFAHSTYEKIAQRNTAPAPRFEQGLIPPVANNGVLTLGLTAVLSLYRLFFGSSVWMLFFALIMPLFFVAPAAKQNIQRFFMLPLGRKQLLARGAAVLAFAQLRVWAMCAVAGLIAYVGLPVMQNLLLSLLLQIPIFAAATLSLSIRNPKRMMVIMMSAAIPIGFLQGWLKDTPALLIAGVVVGVFLIPVSYYRWLNMELDWK